ncbi:MAG: hypothetical protein MUP17_12800 [candidate division Zixibacteria bacterium]|nr:hypothetical protein [candidate division Zixibacteria bacterium]
MTREDDNIEIAKESLRAERRRIEAMIKKLEEDVSIIKKAEDLLSPQSTQITMLGEKSDVKESQRFLNMAPTEAILIVLKDRTDKWWEPLQISAELVAGGFKTKAESLHNTVSATLFRLANEGKLERRQRGKRKSVFRIKQGEQ